MTENFFFKRSPEFASQGRVTWIEKTAGFLGVNRWFIRRGPEIRVEPPEPGSRGNVISPAQSKVQTLLPIGADGKISEKNALGKPREFHLIDIVKDEESAALFYGGTSLKLYLAPYDLHYLVFPLGGKVTDYHYRPGWAVPLLFFKQGDVLNERLCALIETEHGFPILFIMIGSWMVNGIHHSFEFNAPYAMGADIGHFKIGSSVIVLFPEGKVDLTCQVGQKLSLGTVIGKVR